LRKRRDVLAVWHAQPVQCAVDTLFEQTASTRVHYPIVLDSPAQISNLLAFQKRNEAKSPVMLARLKQIAVSNGNLFEELMETVKYCSLGEITHALYEVGGQYRRNM